MRCDHFSDHFIAHLSVISSWMQKSCLSKSVGLNCGSVLLVEQCYCVCHVCRGLEMPDHSVKLTQTLFYFFIFLIKAHSLLLPDWTQWICIHVFCFFVFFNAILSTSLHLFLFLKGWGVKNAGACVLCSESSGFARGGEMGQREWEQLHWKQIFSCVAFLDVACNWVESKALNWHFSQKVDFSNSDICRLVTVDWNLTVILII